MQRSVLGPLAALALVLGGMALPARATGTGTLDRQPVKRSKTLSQLLFSAKGRFSLSVDGGGSLDETYTVQVQKPGASATVRYAVLLAASTGATSYVIPDGGVRLNGIDIAWDEAIPTQIDSWNHQADVTSLVKPVVDAAAAGRISFTVTEATPESVDGTALAVVFEDPGQVQDSTVILLFGAQETEIDAFAISLAQPIQPNSAGALFTMGLAISYSAQDGDCASEDQSSVIDVNGTRLTSAAGGEDEGICQNGALFTVGGLDDSTNNPFNPNAGPGGDPRADDELYSLLPFITGSTTEVTVTTSNPSNDDNVLFAYFQISGEAAVSPEGCSPSATTLCLDDQPGDRRFKAEVSFATAQGGGAQGHGQAIPLGSLGVRRGGLFWFFSADNPEVLVKVLNGCALNDHFWVFFSAGTNVALKLRVTDTVTGRVFRASNLDQQLAQPVAGVEALPCQ